MTRLSRFFILLFALVSMLCFVYAKTNKNQSGKKLFEDNCASCHKENLDATGPPFQKIRESYGLKWTLKYVRNATKMVTDKDTIARYNFHIWKLHKPAYPYLTDSQIVRILNYVDSFPVNESLIMHRKVSMKNKAAYIKKVEEAKAQFEKDMEKMMEDTIMQAEVDWHQFLDKYDTAK